MRRSILIIVGLLLVTIFPVSTQAATGTPKAFSYQGRLYDTSGNLLGGTGATYCFHFSIWDSPTTGGGLKLWPATNPGNTPLPVKFGVFSVNIGIDTPDPLTFDFNQTDTSYLQLEVAPYNGACGTFETLNPRQRLTSTGYAINAGALDGSTAGTGANNILKLDTSGNINLSGSAPGLNSTGITPLTIQGGASGNVQFFSAANTLSSTGTLTLAGNEMLGGYLQASTIQPAAGASLTSTVSKNAVSGNEVAYALNATINKATGNYTGLQLNVTETNAPGNNRLLDLEVGSTSKFAVSSAGAIINGSIPVGSVTGNIVNSIAVNGSTARTGALNLAAGPGVSIVDNNSGTITLSSSASGVTPAGTSGQIQFNNNGFYGASGSLLFDAASNHLGIIGTLQVTGTAGQTANLSQWLNSAGTTVASIDPAGNLLTGNTLTVGSAQGGIIQAGLGQSLTLKGSINSSVGFNGVVIGSSAPDASQVNLQLDTSTVYTETASTCGVSLNQGSLYYNAASGTIRSCTNGAWNDIVTTADLGLSLFGVLPLSGTNPGDLAGSTGASNGPCKVSWATASSVNVSACSAYSGGRKVQIAATTSVAVPMSASTPWVHYCLNGPNNQPILTAGATESSNLTTNSLPNVVVPITCLADIKTDGASIVSIYDTRPFVGSQNQIVSITTGSPALGEIVTASPSTAAYSLSQGAAGSGSIVGVIVATTGAAGSLNAMIATTGPTWIKALAGTVGRSIENTTTPGYADTIVKAPSATYSVLGTSITGYTATTPCTSASTCAGSLFTTLTIR